MPRWPGRLAGSGTRIRERSLDHFPQRVGRPLACPFITRTFFFQADFRSEEQTAMYQELSCQDFNAFLKGLEQAVRDGIDSGAGRVVIAVSQEGFAQVTLAANWQEVILAQIAARLLAVPFYVLPP
jgi:hypothetical protein